MIVIVSVVGVRRDLRAPAAAADRRPRSRARARASAAVVQPGGQGARAADALDRAARGRAERRSPAPQSDDEAEPKSRARRPRRISTAAEQEGLIEGEERRLLQSIVDFGDTLVREVMTPRPDIVAIREHATIGDLRALFREQEYSRFPVFKDSLDNIAGFVFVKDLVALGFGRRRRGRSRRCCGRRSSCRKPSAFRSC